MLMFHHFAATLALGLALSPYPTPAALSASALPVVSPAPIVHQPDSESRSFAIYDLRELNTPSLVIAHLRPTVQSDGSISVDPFFHEPAGADNPSTIEQVLSSLTADMENVRYVQVSPGIYAVTATADQHNAIRSVLSSFRDTYTSPIDYRVEISWTSVSAADAPAVGAESKAAPTDFARFTAATLEQCRLSSLSEFAYIADWQPVVGESTFAYDPEIRTLAAGLDLAAVISDPGPDKRPSVSLTGTLSHFELAPRAGSSTASGFAPMPDLPIHSVRTINARIPVTLGKRTVFAVVQGFDGPGSLIALSIEIDPIQ